MHLRQEEIENKDTSLIVAARVNDLKNLNHLILAKSSLDDQNAEGNTALLIATHHGYHECVKSLLTAKAKVNLQNSMKETPLMRAAQFGDIRCLDILLEAKAIIDTQDTDGETALTKAVGYADCLERLLEAQANINHQNNDGKTALIKAVGEGHTESVTLLIAAKANIHILDNYNNNALAWAYQWSGSEYLEWLLIAGANPIHRHGAHPKETLNIMESADLRGSSTILAITKLCEHQKNAFKPTEDHLNLGEIKKAEVVLKKRKEIHDLHKKNVYLSIDHATGNKIPTVLLDMILDYTPPSDIDLTLQNDHIVFFDPKEINRLLERENEIARTFPPKKNHRNALWLCQFFYNNIKNIFHTNENKLKIK